MQNLIINIKVFKKFLLIIFYFLYYSIKRNSNSIENEQFRNTKMSILNKNV